MAATGSFVSPGFSNPLAGRYGNYLKQAQDTINTFGLPEDDKLFGTAMAFNLANQMMYNDPEMMRKQLELQDEFAWKRAQRQQQLGMQSNIVASFLKDVPAAISNAFAQRQRYTPEKIEIAARTMQNQPRGGTARNYYGFVG